MPDHKLGKRPPRVDPRTLRLTSYLTGLPAPKPAVSWDHGQASWGMMLNDSIGDCVLAARGHAEQLITLNAGPAQITVPDSVILADYERVGGYVPGQPSTDNGADMLTACKDWQHVGVGGHRIAAYVSAPRSQPMVETAINLFGFMYIGLQVPASAMAQFDAGQPWDVVTPDGGIIGGHCVDLIDYGPAGLTCITWGRLQGMSWNFFSTYCDEAYGILTQEWIGANGQSPSGFNLQALQSDLAQLGGQPAPAPPVWTPNANVMTWLTWQQGETAQVLSLYAAGNVAYAQAYQAQLNQYEPGVAALIAAQAKS